MGRINIINPLPIVHQIPMPMTLNNQLMARQTMIDPQIIAAQSNKNFDYMYMNKMNNQNLQNFNGKQVSQIHGKRSLAAPIGVEKIPRVVTNYNPYRMGNY